MQLVTKDHEEEEDEQFKGKLTDEALQHVLYKIMFIYRNTL